MVNPSTFYLHEKNPIYRNSPHWTFKHYPETCHDLATLPKNSAAVLLSKSTKNWRLVDEFTDIEEVVLSQPTTDQVAWVASQTKLCRLRIERSTRKNLDPLVDMEHLEELSLAGISRTNDLSFIPRSSNLRSLRLCNVPGASDLSEIAECYALKSLMIETSAEKYLNINDLNFLSSLENLEHLLMRCVRVLGAYPVFAPLSRLEKLSRLNVYPGYFGIEELAYINVFRPDLSPGVDRYFCVKDPKGRIVSPAEVDRLDGDSFFFETLIKGQHCYRGPSHKVKEKYFQAVENWQRARKKAHDLSVVRVFGTKGGLN